MEEDFSYDDQFLRKIHQCINDNLSDENFSVEDLAKNIGLSRSMLHRKLIKLSGKPAGELIKEIRLNKAKALLEKNVATVSEIAYEVGFKNPSYFNKVFKKRYFISPGDVKKGVQISEDQFKPSKKNLQLSTVLQTKKAKYIFTILLFIFSVSAIAFYITSNTTSEKVSLAVLPLHNLTGQTENNYLVDGMHDVLIGELGQLGSIRVISRTSTLRYRNKDMLLKDIAEELGVNSIIEGSVIGVEDSIKLLIQLIDVFPKERHLLAKEYKDIFSNTLNIQSSIIKDIAQKVHIQFSEQEKLRLSANRRVNPETYKAYLRGMYQMNQGTKESFAKGIEYLQEAIEKDPGDPFAYAGLAVGYTFMGHGQINSEEAFRLAMRSANKAIKLDPTIDEAYIALAILYLYNLWDWPKSKKAFEDAIRNNPNNAIAHAHFAWYHILFDDMEKSIYHAEQAVILEPFSAAYACWLGLIYYHFHQYDMAEKWAHKALELKENIPFANATLGWVCIERKDYKKAVEHLEKLPANNSHWSAILGHGYVKAGQREKALAIWDKLNKKHKKPDIYHMGIMASYLGFTDKAFELINEAYENKTYPITYINFYPCSEDIRNDSRYTDLLRKLNIPPRKAIFTSTK